MKKTFLFLLIVLINNFSYGQNDIQNYVDFLKKQETPKEYIFNLWEQADIIVLGERDHRDTTQYNLILDILSDKRFIENVGYVF